MNVNFPIINLHETGDLGAGWTGAKNGCSGCSYLIALSYLALHFAVMSCNTSVILPLLKAGANIDALSEQGKTPLDLAKEKENQYIIHQLKNEQYQRGVGKPGFIRKITSDPVSILPFWALDDSLSSC